MKKNHHALRKLGLNIRGLRESRNVTQERLAEAASLDPTYISGIERGVRNPSVLSLLRISKALETTISEVSRGIDQ